MHVEGALCSITLKNILEKNFRAEYAERRAEMVAVTQPAAPEVTLPTLRCRHMPYGRS